MGSPPRESRKFRKLNVTDVLLVAFTACLALATFLLWRATRELVAGAEETAERQIRAYVYLGPVGLNLQKNANGSFTFTVDPSLKVFGITPAAWVSPTWDLKILPAWPVGKFPELPIKAGSADLVEVPGQDYHIETKNVILQEADIDALTRQVSTVIAFGRVTYNDVFQKHRWTDFCIWFNWHGMNTNSAQICPKHNDADWNGTPPPRVVSTALIVNIRPSPLPHVAH